MTLSRRTSAFKWDELDLVHAPADALLRELGYEFVPTDVLDAERESLAEPVLCKRLDAALRRLNPWINDGNATRAIRAITQVTATGLVEANERVHTTLVHNLSLEQDLGKGPLGQTVRFIDFDAPHNNEFLFTHQYRVAGAKQTIVMDLVIFVNGLPLVVIECVSPTIDKPLERAEQELLRYQEADDVLRGLGALRLFHTAQIIIATCGQAATYGTVGTPASDWSEWKVSHPLTLDQLTTTLGRIPTPQDVLLCGMVSPQNLLDLVQNFIVFEVQGSQTHKQLARYPQFMAVNRAIERIRNNQHAARGGVVWHTQGTGKSLTMIFLAVKLRRIVGAANPTLLVVSDRKELDDQITAVFVRCGFPNPVQARNARHLRELLTRRGGQTVMTTVQKFQGAATEEHPVLNDGDNVFVMVDEAHRSQHQSLATKMRRALPNACFIGFTSTPTRSTTQIFGDYIHTYTFEQAIVDRVTVPIYYEPRLVSEHVAGESDETVAIAGLPSRVEAICRDLIGHFETFIQPNRFKAQVVACSREVAVSYKETLDRLGAPESAIIISTTHKDPEQLARQRSSKEDQRQMIARFKDSDDPLAILVVCDMLLTGFDAPIEQVMYLDAPLREHVLLQAIARVNRIADGKDYGLIVDYWGIGRSLQEALGAYSASEVQGVLRPKTDLTPLLESFRRAAMMFFPSVPRDDVEGWLRVLEPEDARAAFEQAFRRFARGMDMLLPDPATQPLLADLMWLAMIRNAARIRFRDERLDLSGLRPKVRALLEADIGAPLRPPVSVLASDFDEEIRKLESAAARASELEHAIRHEIGQRFDANPIRYQCLQEQLTRINEDRRESRIDAAEHLRLLCAIVHDLRHVEQVAQAMGLDEASLALYQLLGAADEPTGARDGVDSLRREQAVRLLDELRELAVVDWIQKEDVQRRMRQAVKRSLRRSHSGASIDTLVSKVMDLARIWLARL